MSKPLLSGFCNPDNPPTSHGRCRLDGCTCSCHQLAVDSGSAPRPKVPLACLQGRHTPECGHLPAVLDRLLDQPVPGGDTVTYERGGDPLADLAAARDAVTVPLTADGERVGKVQAASRAAVVNEVDKITKALAGHNHTWAPLQDPHGIYQGKAYVCTGPLGGGCGATMDSQRVYAFGEVPGGVRDDLEPTGVQLVLDPSPVELTVTERARVIAAHSVLDPSAALEVARALISERMAR